MKNILAIIPARAGSKGVPRKNLVEIDGKPLIYYSIHEAKKSKYITRIVVSTDGEEIANVSKSFGAEVMMRPEELATDTAKTMPVLKHVVNYLKETDDYSPDIIVLLQPTSPLRTFQDIDKVIEKLLHNDYDSTVSVCENEHTPEWLLIEEDNKSKFYIGQRPSNLRRQDIKKTYFINGAVYAVTLDCLMNREDYILGDNIGIVVMDKLNSFQIDDLEDLEIIKSLKEHGPHKNTR